MRGLGTMACEAPDKVGKESGAQPAPQASLTLLVWRLQGWSMVSEVLVIYHPGTNHHTHLAAYSNTC